MAGRKRKAVTPAGNESRPSKRATRKSADAKSASDDPDKKEEDSVAPPTIDFSDLPAHFLTEVANKLTYTDLASFRLTCKKALEAVDHSGRSQRALDITRLVAELWPEKRAEMHNFQLDSLMTVEKEMAKLDSWLDFDLINSIDFTNINCLNQPQLEIVFGDKPRGNVKKLNLVGIVIMPEVWTTLARLFPGVKNVRCTEDASHFPTDILREMQTVPNKNLAPHTLVEQRTLVEGGQLDKDRVVTLRCLKRLFPKAQYMFVD